ncbi:MAG: hypothetical protein A2145_02540 [candidate division Zixibacteria bacterium RBG_16_40_9]|nr:MAG: hypothetical protein A2145_02540 [candidate division Zixibacteria bacterium RBG_16_40_9]
MKKLFPLLVLLLLGVLTCTKNPSGPTTPESSLVYVNVYSKILVIDSSQDKVVDSIKFDFPIAELNLSADRRILYIQRGYDYCYRNCPDSFVEVNVSSKAIRYQGENSDLFPTPDGKYIVSTRNGLKIFSTFNHQIVYENNLNVTTRPTFDSQYPLFYVGMADKRILVFDYQRLQIVKYLEALRGKQLPPIFDILYSEIDNKLYFSSYFSTNDTPFTSYMGNMDTKRDRLITIERLDTYEPWGYWGEGYLSSSKALQKIYLLSSTYGAVIPEFIPYNFMGFSITSRKIVSSLGVYNYFAGFSGVQIFDDGTKAYIIGMGGYNLYGILIIDLVENKIIGTIPIP